MIGPKDLFSSSQPDSPSFDRTKIRLSLFGIVILAAFLALFSRLWFLQVLASDDFRRLASENRVRKVQSQAERGRVLDRNGVVLIDNRSSQSFTIDREVLDKPRKKKMVLHRLSKLLNEPVRKLESRLADGTVSPYTPVAVANDVPKRAVKIFSERQENFPGVNIEKRFVRTFPQGNLGGPLLGYTGEITAEQLKEDYFKNATPAYQPGDIVGRGGLEQTYDKLIRGKPEIQKVIVNSSGKVVRHQVTQQAQPGQDLILSLDARIQKLTEKALASGIYAARGAGYNAPDGAAVVIDPTTGGVVASASFPTFDPRILADGYSYHDQKVLLGDPNDPLDDANQNRVIQTTVNPGSTFKVATAGAAMATGIMGPYDYRNCPGQLSLAGTIFHNWTSSDMGSMGIPMSLEVSCDTFYYELGWEMENRWGAANGDGSEKFQAYLRTAGFGHPTGVDLPSEYAGNVPDEAWCQEQARAQVGCAYGWLPGYTVNMAIGQQDLLATPLQMAVSYAALVNGGNVLRPHVAAGLGVPDPATGVETPVRTFTPETTAKLPLDETEMGVIRQGLSDVISGPQGTGASAFIGFPLDRYPVAGKTGTAQYSATSPLNRAWFVSYAPANNPKYVVAVYIDQADHGGVSAAPVARQIYEGIFHIDNQVQVGSGSDNST